MNEQTIKALEKYNKKWSNFIMTGRLYRKAAKTAKFGCHIQDELLVRLGADIPAHTSRKHYGRAVENWFAWMMA